MFLRVASHTIREGSLNAINMRAIQCDTLVETVHLRLQVGRMLMIKLRILLRGIQRLYIPS